MAPLGTRNLRCHWFVGAGSNRSYWQTGIKRRTCCSKGLHPASPPANWPMKDSSWTSIASSQNCWATKTAGWLAGREIAKASATSLRRHTPRPIRTMKGKRASSWTHGFRTICHGEYDTCNRCIQVIYATMVGTADLAVFDILDALPTS